MTIRHLTRIIKVFAKVCVIPNLNVLRGAPIMLRPFNGFYNKRFLCDWFVIVAILCGSLSLNAQTTGISGVVKSSAGEPVTGALVRVSSQDSGLTFMVVSQQQGRYSTPTLLSGKYIVQAFGGISQSNPSSPVEVSGTQQGTMDLTLNVALQIPPREKRMTDEDYEKLMPEGPGKKLAADQCATCHSLLPVVSARKTREQWQQVYDRMLDDMFDLRKLMIYHQPSENSEVVLGYLARSFGPDTPPNPLVMKQWLLRPGGPAHPNRNLPSTLLKGAAAKYVAMEFSLPSGAQPRDIAVDSQGIAWVSERGTGMIGRFDPNSLTYTRIAPPGGKSGKVQTDAVEVDSRGLIWFADDGPNGRMLQYNPKGGEFNSYLLPEYRFLVPPDIGWARIQRLRFSDGNVWALGLTSSRILRLDLMNRRVVDYSIPKGSVPLALVVPGDGSVWYSSKITSEVVKLDPASGRLTKYYLPLEEKERADLRGMAADADGNLWMGASEIGKLIKLDTHTGHFTEFAPPTRDSGPYAVDVDTSRNLVWVSEAFTDRIARYDPRAGSFVEFSHASADQAVKRIEVDRSRPNRVWWAGSYTGKIGYFETID
ncbi:MAG TPA: carboxypeptidase regulatory-like domain-containing protein [Terriglobia bacterium]|nr:carboxypeptidase regulatory-like domain-containing protein [Terriglobia bacterium]